MRERALIVCAFAVWLAAASLGVRAGQAVQVKWLHESLGRAAIAAAKAALGGDDLRITELVIEYAAQCSDGAKKRGLGVVGFGHERDRSLGGIARALRYWAPLFASLSCESGENGTLEWPMLYRVAALRINAPRDEAEARAKAEEAAREVLRSARVAGFRFLASSSPKVWVRVEARGHAREATGAVEFPFHDEELERLAHEVTVGEIKRLAAERGLKITKAPTFEEAVAASGGVHDNTSLAEALKKALEAYEAVSGR